MLILSFSPLAGDARVLKQIRHFAPLFDVTTCGYGPSPHPDVEHLEIPASAGVELDGRLITLRAYRAVHARVPGTSWLPGNTITGQPSSRPARANMPAASA